MAKWICKNCGAHYIGNYPGCPICGSINAYRVYVDRHADKIEEYIIKDGKRASPY